MTFVPRTFEEIRDDMIDFVRLNTDLTDFEVGSVIRTIIEAAALEDDEQYYQIVQLLDAFKLSSSSGQDLDDRVEEYGIIRLQPASSAGNIVIQNGALATTTLAFDVSATDTSVELEDSSVLPTAGFPYTVRIGEGTTSVEDVSVSANTVGTNTLTVSALASDHAIGVRASLVSGAADKALGAGIRAQVPATGTDVVIVFTTVEAGSIVDGNYESTPLAARAEVPGSDGNIGSQKITEFTDSPPFDGAVVTNIANFSGGRGLEIDASLRDRAKAVIQSLSRGTVLAIREGVIGVADPVTGQQVVTSNIIESFVTNEVTLYVDDGTGFIPDQIQLARTTLAATYAAPTSLLLVADASEFPEEGWVLISPETAAVAEILAYTSVDYGTNTITLSGATANSPHTSGEEVVLVDLVEDSSEVGANFFNLANFPVVDGSLRLWIDPPTGNIALQTIDTDFVVNRGNGQIEFTGSGLAATTVVAASYDYYAGLLAEVQKVVDGDLSNPTNYPGLKAAGTKVVVETPTIRRVTVRVSITPVSGLQVSDLSPEVQESIEAYINGLGVGEDVIIARIVGLAMAVTGVIDVIVTLPTTNLTILENELPVPFDTDGTSLVTVT